MKLEEFLKKLDKLAKEADELGLTLRLDETVELQRAIAVGGTIGNQMFEIRTRISAPAEVK